MVQGIPMARTAPDACPGALRPHHAADGDLVRLRLPGGLVPRAALLNLADAARTLADGRIGLTSRANLQVRAVRDVDGLAARVQAAGLLPAPEHERVRNIVASALGGRLAGAAAPTDAMTHALDAGLCARAVLSALPGRFLFAVDDGRGDVAGLGADVTLVAGADGWRVRCGTLEVAAADPVEVALDVAQAFLDERGRAWRVRELEDGPARLMHVLGLDAAATGRSVLTGVRAPAGPPAAGLTEQADGRFAVCGLVPLGVLEADQVTAVAAAAELGDGTVRVTPWRRIALADLELPAALAARELLAASGLVVEADSAWARVTACAGRPGCAKSLTDVRADARLYAATAPTDGPDVHWVGCERGCGTPSGAVRMVATGTGYRAVAGTTDEGWE